ncbi:lysozyme inhibitor LprI family protein [Lachnospiraceae bacterium 62-35]
MKRTAGMLAAIFIILLFGAGITAYTSNIVKKQQAEIAADTIIISQEDAADNELSPIQTEEAVGVQDSMEAPGSVFEITVGVVEGTPKGRQKAQEEKQSEAAAAASPLEGASPLADYAASNDMGSGVEEGSEKEISQSRAMAEDTAPKAALSSNIAHTEKAGMLPEKESMLSDKQMMSDGQPGDSQGIDKGEDTATKPYEERLAELEAQASRFHLQGDSSSQYAVQNAVESEYKLWDGELNRIYNIILNALSREEAEALVKEQRDWIILRDQMAAEAGADKGGSMESIEYRMKLSSLIRERIYTLAEQYGQLLAEE